MRNVTRLIALAALTAASVSCGEMARQGRSPAYLIVDKLEGKRGGLASAPFGVPLPSDIITNVVSPAPCSASSPCPIIFSDEGRLTVRAEMKDPSLTSPTTTNNITLTRYHVKYVRSDGHNIEGVDVPYAWDGASTASIPVGTSVAVPFELVRAAAKMESPLVNLFNGAIMTTVAQVTFFGYDQAGNEVVVSGLIQIDFGNFGDF